MEKLEKDLKSHVVKLSEEIGERNYVYYNSLNDAADYIIAEFKKYGYDPKIHTYNIGNRSYRNIIAEKEGSVKPDEIVVVGAHYDSVTGSPGANDNGTGVAALLEFARMFSGSSPGRTIRFIAFVNEEPPFFLTNDMGSRIYAREIREKGEDVKAMICLETIGYYSDERRSQRYPLWYGFFYPDQANFIGIVGNFRSRGLARQVTDAFRENSTFNIETVIAPAFIEGVTFSDHDSFWRQGYEAVMVTDTAFYRYPYYHTMMDTYDKVDYPGLAEVVKGLYHVLVELSKS